jgi:uncharacterized protein (DUF305 family)
MKTRRAGRRIALVSALALSSVTLGGAVASGLSDDPATTTTAEAGAGGFYPQHVPRPAYAFGETLSKLAGPKLEITFMAGIIPHHADAIEMAQMELARGQSADLRAHAENIIASQRHQIEQFTAYLRTWYGLTPEQAMAQMPAEAMAEHEAMMAESRRSMDELASVPAGHQFDVAFAQRMIPHHQAGIIEFLEPQGRARHAALRVAASTGINEQQAEATDFRTWLAGA